MVSKVGFEGFKVHLMKEKMKPQNRGLKWLS